MVKMSSTSQQISNGTVHDLPVDFRQALSSSSDAISRWNDLTPLARNEWICWIISVKRQDTREAHIKRAVEELLDGERRPCCWYGCIHRTDKKVSPSVQAIIVDKQRKSR